MEKIKLLLYCTKSKPYLSKVWNYNYELATDKEIVEQDAYNGKIVAECDFEVEEITPYQYQEDYYSSMETGYKTKTTDFENLLKKSGLTHSLIDCYLRCDIGYAIHIKNLHIFDKPRIIREYYNLPVRTMADCFNQKLIKKAPQNMCNAYDVYKNHYIAISIRPEWLCKILNGEKTIEVRKKVLKEMMPR